MLTDLRQAFRRLLKSPGFALVAMLTLALGLGANITVFAMLNEFLLRPLRVDRPEELVFLMQKSPKFELPFAISYSDFRDMRRSLSVAGGDGGNANTEATFTDMLAYAMFPVHLSEQSRMAERAWIHAATGNYFDLLGIRPHLGRFFLPGEGEHAGADPIVVLGFTYWKERFNADPRIVGTTIDLNGEAFTIVGVAPEAFGGVEAMSNAQLFVPLTMWDVLQPNNKGALEHRGNSSFMVVGRLQPGVTVDQARTSAGAVLERLVADHPDSHADSAIEVIPEIMSRPSPYVSRFAPAALIALMLLAMLVLCVAMANIANLLYARAAEATHSLAVRSSLGATRWRLIRFLLAESLLLAVGAGILGWYASEGFGYLLQSVTVTQDNPPQANYDTDWRPVVFTGAVALAAGLVTGIFPALRATRRDLLPALNESSRSYVNTRHPLRSLLVAGQVALSCIVLVCAGLAVHSLYLLAHVDLGFRPDNVFLATFDLELQRYDKEQAQQFQKTLLDEVRALPGVKAASLARAIPFDRGIGLRGGIGAEGQPPPEHDDMFLVACVTAAPGYLEALGIPLIGGRDIHEFDTDDKPPVAIINEAVARHFWPGEDPVGKRLTFWGGKRIVEVVGLVKTGRFFMMSDRDRPMLITPLAQEFSPNVTLVAHTENDPLQLTRPVQDIARRLDSGLPVFNIRTLEEQITGSALGLMPLRFGAIIAISQGAIVLLLAVMGLYGLVSFAVACRTREIGIRMALGATRGNILTLITRPSLILCAVGLLIGFALAFICAQPLAGLLYGATPSVLLVFSVVGFLVCFVTVFAAWMPARRATRIDPVEALRAE